MAGKKSDADADDGIAREDIEAQIARLRADLAQLAGLVAGYGSGQLKDAETQAVEELQRQLSNLQDGLRRRMQDQPLQVLGMAALAGLVLGLMLRR